MSHPVPDDTGSGCVTDAAGRVLVLAPIGRDAALIARSLARAAIVASVCPDLDALLAALGDGAGALLIAEEVLTSGALHALSGALAAQPAWSDVPLVVLTHAGEVTPVSVERLGGLAARGSVTLVERPTRPRTLVTAVQAALRARRRQYELRDLLAREQAARREAEHANHVMNEFFARASHELREPLTAMSLWLERLRSARPGQTAKALAAVEQSAARQARLVSDLLDIASGLAGKLRVERERIDVTRVVTATLEEAEPTAAAQKITLDTDRPREALWVLGDFARLQQAVANLVGNAIKFSPAGGRVEIRLARADGRVRITVRDAGRGISPEFLPHVFSPYAQEEQGGTFTRAHGGLGLGLAIVQQIVGLHGGAVRAESAGEGRGATFTIELPLAAAPADAASSETNARGEARGALGRLRVLIVDDDTLLREGLLAVLAHHGAVATAAASAAEARAVLARERFDVLLCDLAMPGEDGYTLLRELRTRSADEGGATPAIALSGQARDEDRARALAAGFQEHVTKPVAPAVLVAALTRVAAGGRA